MPLVRVEVRNEFGLGRRELYVEGANREDPKAAMDGVAVAGLTGILRQLGDLSEFAAEVFHGLQEQITMTSSRSHKLIARAQRLEDALPSLEKLVLSQTSHIHFAYTAGSEWHTRSQSAQHHFIDNDLPRFIMDFYEECRDPPRLHLLDKFDPGGAGSCLRRYSDPTFFRKVSTSTDETNSLRVRGEKKARKIKKKRPLSKNAVFAHGASRFNQSSRLQFSSPIMSGLSSPTPSVSDSTFKSDAGHGLNSSGMRTRSGYIECIINNRNEMQPEEQESSRSSSSRLMLQDVTVNSVSTHEGSPAVGGYFMQKEPQEGSTSVQSSITWDEKAEIVVDAEEYKHELNEATTEVGEEYKHELNEAATQAEVEYEHGLNEAATRAPEEYKHGLNDATTKAPEEYKHELIEATTKAPEEYKHELIEATTKAPEECKHELNEATTEAEVPTSSGVSFGQAISEKMDEAHILQHDNDNTKAVFPVNSAEDADSGPDNYEDALNAIDTESEGELEYQTKLEVMQHFTGVDAEEVGVANDELMPQNLDCSPSNIKNDSSYVNPPVKVAFLHSSEHASSDSGNEGVIHQDLGGLPNSESSPLDLASQSVDSGNIENLGSVGCLLGSGSPPRQNLPGNLVEHHLVKHQESPSKIPGVQFWTNGGLLGLQPSKPPIFAASNTPGSGSGVGDTNAGISNENLDKKSGTPAKIAECIEKELSEPFIVDGGPAYNDEISTVPSTSSAGVISETLSRNWRNYLSREESTSTMVVVPGNLIPAAPTSNIAQNETHRGTEENFSSIFGLGQKLLTNSLSFRKKISPNGDEGSNTAVHSQSVLHNQGSRFPVGSTQTDSLSAFKDQFQNAVGVNQRPPSPPLEHMKISFRPMNGFGASSLRLKFPYGTDCQDSSRDMFASFQLVPESTIPFQDIGWNSDDGTFCRSSPYMSDDSASHLSASESDDWESNDSSKDKEHDQHGNVQRLSSAGSVPTTRGIEGVALHQRFGSMQSDNGEDTVASFSLREMSLGLPSFESMNSPTVQELDICACDPLQFAPLPPPFPLADWKTSNHDSNGSEIMQVLENDSRHAVSETSEPDMFRHPKEAPTWPGDNNQEISEATLKSNGHPKLSPHKESNLNANCLETNEGGDFLHQIRAKSFSLRPTVPRPTSTAPTTANFKVTAILQKANAIRQAVGSENGDDDDSWSDI
ncbi:hypothetical protein MLD38_016725 [Melastoma candidum]|uniref:Uncharacterized protein n=1 Tax=Melastoma candidum TaxID=119954 RepID=A0ACB9QMP2_9MYRT|nr:hypothetical protein MLD38_016725 [Melastoma candidum]